MGCIQSTASGLLVFFFSWLALRYSSILFLMYGDMPAQMMPAICVRVNVIPYPSAFSASWISRSCSRTAVAVRSAWNIRSASARSSRASFASRCWFSRL